MAREAREREGLTHTIAFGLLASKFGEKRNHAIWAIWTDRKCKDLHCGSTKDLQSKLQSSTKRQTRPRLLAGKMMNLK